MHSMEKDLEKDQIIQLRRQALIATGCQEWDACRFYVDISTKKYPSQWQEYDLEIQRRPIEAFSQGVKFIPYERTSESGKTYKHDLDLLEMKQIAQADTQSGWQASREIFMHWIETPPGKVFDISSVSR